MPFYHYISSVQFSFSVVSDSLRPRGLQLARLHHPSPTPGACSNSCPLSQWWHPTISSSVVPFSSCYQSFPASGSFPVFYMAIIWFYLYFCLLLIPLHIYSPLLSHKMLKLRKIGCCEPSFALLSIGNLIYTHGFRNQHDCPWFISEICFDLFIELPT